MGKGGGGKGGFASSRNGGSSDGAFRDWVCPIEACGYLNFASRPRCRLCWAHPSGRRDAKGCSKGQGGQQTLAQRQVQLEKMRSQHEQREEALKKENAELRRERDAALATKNQKTNDGDDDDPMDEEDSEDIAGALELARKKRKAMQGLWDDTEPEAVRLDEEIKRLVRRRDEAKPQRARLRMLERRTDACQKKVDSKTKAIDALEERISKILEERKELQSDLQKATKELDEARAERANELQKALDEESSRNAAPNGGKQDGGCAAGQALDTLRAETIARLPGAPTELAAAVDKTMGQLLALHKELPAQPVQPPSQPGHAAVSVQPGSGAPTTAAEGAAASSGQQGGTSPPPAAAPTPQPPPQQRPAQQNPSVQTDGGGGGDAGGEQQQQLRPQQQEPAASPPPEAAAAAAPVSSEVEQARRKSCLARKQQEQRAAIQRFEEEYRAKLAKAGPSEEMRKIVEGEAVEEISDMSDESESDNDVELMELVRKEGETDLDRDDRIAKYLKDKREKRKARREERRKRRVSARKGGAGASRLVEAKTASTKK